MADVIPINPESRAMVSALEASIKAARVDKARKAYAAAMAKVLTWTPGDMAEALRVYGEALGEAQAYIDALER